MKIILKLFGIVIGVLVVIGGGLFLIIVQPGPSGVIAALRLPDGSEYMVAQRCNWSLEPYTVSFYMRSADGPWGWCYIDHQASRWRNVAMTYDQSSDIITVKERGTWQAALDRKRKTFAIGDGKPERDVKAPQVFYPPEFAFPLAPVDAGRNAKHRGEMRVEGLGKLTFPPGMWQLESRRLEGDSNRIRPDYFVFRKSGDPIERLTILRYNPAIAPQLPHLLDYLGEAVGTGVPRDSNWEKITGTHVFLHAEPRDLKPVDGHMAYSFVFDPLDETPRWLCHCFLFTTEGWDFVIVHTSTSVTSPEIAQEVFAGSAFDKK